MPNTPSEPPDSGQLAVEPTVINTPEPTVKLTREQMLQRKMNELDRAISANNDEQIIRAWGFLEEYEPARRFQMRVEYAKKRIAALKRFRTALQINDHDQIVKSYDRILNKCPDILPEEWQQLSEAILDFFSGCNLEWAAGKPLDLLLRFMNAYYREDNDEAITTVYADIQNINIDTRFGFTKKEMERIQLAQRRVAARQSLLKALGDGSIQSIVAVYDTQLHADKTGLTQDEQETVELAKSFKIAYDADDYLAIVKYADAIRDSSHRQSFKFTEQESLRIQQARKEKKQLEEFQAALKSRGLEHIDETYTPALEHDNHVKSDEHERAILARRFVAAFRKNDRRAVIAVYNQVMASPYKNAFTFSPKEWDFIYTVPAPSGPSSGLTIVIINGYAISYAQFVRIHTVKKAYLHLRSHQMLRNLNTVLPSVRDWVRSQRALIEQSDSPALTTMTLRDIENDFAIQNEIKKGEFETVMKADELDVDDQLNKLYQDLTEFVQLIPDGTIFQGFIRSVPIEEVRTALAIYVRRELLAEYWSRQARHITIDEWLNRRKKDLYIIYPPRPEQNMGGEQGGRSNKDGRKPPRR